MFYFSANLNNIKCRRQATSPIEQPAEVSEPQKLHCLLGKRSRTGGGEGRGWERKKQAREWEMKIDSSCVCVCVCVWLVPKSNPRAITEAFSSSEARGNVHFTQRLVGAQPEVRGHHLDSFSYLGTSPYSADWGHAVWPRKPATPNPLHVPSLIWLFGVDFQCKGEKKVFWLRQIHDGNLDELDVFVYWIKMYRGIYCGCLSQRRTIYFLLWTIWLFQWTHFDNRFSQQTL